ncbi:MAG: hypothetical protein WAU56_10420 [Steroidobacteraceae bacterium]
MPTFPRADERLDKNETPAAAAGLTKQGAVNRHRPVEEEKVLKLGAASREYGLIGFESLAEPLTVFERIVSGHRDIWRSRKEFTGDPEGNERGGLRASGPRGPKDLKGAARRASWTHVIHDHQSPAHGCEAIAGEAGETAYPFGPHTVRDQPTRENCAPGFPHDGVVIS